ncbi:deoxynucleoside triphosphate triphosphohydrolase SAMHD1 [Acrasis kona]|uniref:Deoxynucleoside triphosphate triphosphohydrolase SAMHD1 n=1 Tax=Acrasis kona TaxID=1008807 RepID=A0AAW2YMR1_9EUKA
MPAVEYRVINDPIYGLIRLDNRLFKIIDTEFFQRLRDIKQLGALDYVFPGATHNRFAHSIGTCYLAGKWLELLRDKMDKEGVRHTNSVYIKGRDILQVQIAALCHDLGHGPFSHMFEDVFISSTEPKIDFSHEDMSIKLLEKIWENIDPQLRASITKGQAQDEYIAQIFNMIKGEVPEDTKKPFLYRIVCNTETGFDVDKLDYLVRDTKSAGVPLSFDQMRLLEFSMIKNYKETPCICFDLRSATNLANVFVNRFDLHKDVYSHRVVDGIEMMIGDIFRIASEKDPVRFNLSNSVGNADDYYLLTDSILKEIERSNIEGCKELIKRLRRRDFYKCLVRLPLKVDLNKENIKGELKKMVEEQKDKFAQIIIDRKLERSIEIKSRTFTFGVINPLKNVLFYNSVHDTPSTMPSLFSSKFSNPVIESELRFYIKDTKNIDTLWAQVIEIIQKGSEGNHNVMSPVSTPSKYHPKQSFISDSDGRDLNNDFYNCTTPHKK